MLCPYCKGFGFLRTGRTAYKAIGDGRHCLVAIWVLCPGPDCIAGHVNKCDPPNDGLPKGLPPGQGDTGIMEGIR